MASPTLVQASPSHSPYREYVHLKKVNRQIKLEAPIKAGIFFAIAAFFYADVYHISFLNRLLNLPDFVDYIKATVSAVMVVLSVGHLASFAYAHLSPDREIEDSHAKLLNISKDDLGFKIKPDTPRRSRTLSPNIEKLPAGSFCLPSAQDSFNESYNNNSVASTSWQYQSTNKSIKTSPTYEKLLSISRFPNSRALDWHIENEESAEAYLQERSREHSYFGSLNDDLDLSFSPKKTSVIDSGVEAIQRLFKAQPYKAASPSRIEKDKSESDSAVICRRWHIDEKQLFKWNEQLRFWFHREIFVPLRDRINELNVTISNLGFSKDNLIGTASIQQLRNLTAFKNNATLGIENIIPYMEITSNQQYLFERIKDFCKGGALSEMNWNRGGNSWHDQLPSDAEIIMNAFCTYIDSRLTADPQFPDGRQFTKLHFKSSLGEVRIETKGSEQKVLIHHTKRCPPHYLLQINENVVDVGSGSNNALHTIILFLYYHKIKKDSRICRMSMSACGLDLLRIIS